MMFVITFVITFVINHLIKLSMKLKLFTIAASVAVLFSSCSKRTETEKCIEGKWVEIIDKGHYPIVLEIDSKNNVTFIIPPNPMVQFCSVVPSYTTFKLVFSQDENTARVTNLIKSSCHDNNVFPIKENDELKIHCQAPSTLLIGNQNNWATVLSVVK